jgi:hypothetical protein
MGAHMVRAPLGPANELACSFALPLACWEWNVEIGPTSPGPLSTIRTPRLIRQIPPSVNPDSRLSDRDYQRADVRKKTLESSRSSMHRSQIQYVMAGGRSRGERRPSMLSARSSGQEFEYKIPGGRLKLKSQQTL